jgi:hypothetical protein
MLFPPVHVHTSTAVIYVADTLKQGHKYKYHITELERLGPEIHTLTPLADSAHWVTIPIIIESLPLAP